MIGNRFYTWFKNYYQWVGGAFSETLLLPLVRATNGLRAGAIRYDEATDTVETYDGTNWNAIPSASGFVPYTGATTDVDLGNEGISAGYLKLDVSPSGTPTDQGTIYWDASTETAALIMNGTTQHIGQDVFYYVKNSTGSPIPKGTAVRFAGTDGNSGHLLIAPFIANGSVPSTYFMGVTSEAIANGGFGKVMHFGELEGINTNSFQDGDILYASTTVAGGFQTTVPTAPNNIIEIAAVVNAANNGILLVRPTLGSNINRDEGVRIISPIAGQGLFYDNGLWVNKSIATVLGYTPVPPTRMITINGTAQDLSADRTWTVGDVRTDSTYSNPTWITALAWSKITSTPTSLSGYGITDGVVTGRTITINGTSQDLSANRTYNVGTVTSVNLSTSTPGINIFGTTPITTSGTININIATASGSQQGLLSSTDWTTFNNKQAALTLTTTGNSGASTLTGATLNVPTYTLSGLGGVPTSRTITINGTTQDLSSNRTYNVGTVTSVGLTTSTTGVTIGSTPVTGSGNITIDIATASGSTIGLLSSTDWTTFNNKQNALTLTTSGSSGAATLVGATLNIPQYQAAGNYITALTGEVTASGPGSASATLTNSAVIGKVLTGLNLTGGGTIASTDSILQAFGKIQNQISAMVGGVMFQGTWNANTNTPTLASGVGTKGHYYIVDVSGTTTLDGKSDWRVGDWAIFNGTAWDKVDNTDAVSSVNGFTGAVSLSTSHINEGTNLYYTDARARAAITLTTTGNSGSATYDASGVLNVPTYTLAGLGGVASTRTLTINGTAFDLSADRSWSVGTVTSVGLSSATSGVTIGNTPVTGSGTITLAIATASGSQNGLLSSTDWTTFNNKQNALTNPVTGTGTTAALALFNGTSSITFSQITDNGTSVTIPYLSGTGQAFITATNTGQLVRGNNLSSISLTVSDLTVGALGSGIVVVTNGTLQHQTGTANRFLRWTNSTVVVDSSLREDGSGNLGLGVTPSAWASNTKAIQISDASFWGVSSLDGYASIGGNYFYNGSFIYLKTGPATDYYQYQGLHAWRTAPSGTAGNAISFTQAMTLDASGRLGIGSSATAPDLPLVVHVNSSTAYTTSSRANVLRVYNTTTSTNTFAGIELGVEGNANGAVAGVNAIWTGSGSAALSFYTRDNSTFGEKMRITSGGNVLVGTQTDGGQKLQVNGQAYFQNTATGIVQMMSILAPNMVATNEAYFNWGRSNTNNDSFSWNFKYVGSGSTSNEAILYAFGSSPLLSVTAAGNSTFAGSATAASFIPSGSTIPSIGMYTPATNTVSISANSAERLQVNLTGILVTGGSITTGAPSGGTAQAWKLGTVATVSPTSPNRTIEVEVNGTTYYLHAKTTNN